MYICIAYYVAQLEELFVSDYPGILTPSHIHTPHTINTLFWFTQTYSSYFQRLIWMKLQTVFCNPSLPNPSLTHPTTPSHKHCFCPSRYLNKKCTHSDDQVNWFEYFSSLFSWFCFYNNIFAIIPFKAYFFFSVYCFFLFLCVVHTTINCASDLPWHTSVVSPGVVRGAAGAMAVQMSLSLIS